MALSKKEKEELKEKERIAAEKKLKEGDTPDKTEPEELEEKCSLCGEVKEVEPLGPNKENVCADCGADLLKKAQEAVIAFTPKPKSRSGYVVVCSALPSGQLFNLDAGRTLQINGRKESKFVGENGLPLSGNQYGITKGVKRADWEYVMETVGGVNGCKFLKNETMFACSEADFADRIKDNKDLRTGFEQVDTDKTRTKSVKKKDVN